MFRVIDTIRYDGSLFRHRPEIATQFGQGLLAILDPAQIRSAPFQPGDWVLIHRPDGSSLQQIVGAIEIGAGSVVGVFFAGLKEAEIPWLSQIERRSATSDSTSVQSTDH
jgi:hypothetical protein